MKNNEKERNKYKTYTMKTTISCWEKLKISVNGVTGNVHRLEDLVLLK